MRLSWRYVPTFIFLVLVVVFLAMRDLNTMNEIEIGWYEMFLTRIPVPHKPSATFWVHEQSAWPFAKGWGASSPGDTWSLSTNPERATFLSKSSSVIWLVMPYEVSSNIGGASDESYIGLFSLHRFGPLQHHSRVHVDFENYTITSVDPVSNDRAVVTYEIRIPRAEGVNGRASKSITLVKQGTELVIEK